MQAGRTRRAILAYGVSAAVSLAVFPAEATKLLPKVRRLSFQNLHTGESWSDEYWADGRYEPEALAGIRHVLRDHRTGTSHDIDVRLLDLLVNLRWTLDSTQRFEVISGYRSPQTNAMLRSESSGVAAASLHMQGEAIDMRLPGRSLAKIRDAALWLGQGGVGYYPRSDFVHVDVGRVRRW
jgi:uncharacterized protein YcbK (DUF882 family)